MGPPSIIQLRNKYFSMLGFVLQRAKKGVPQEAVVVRQGFGFATRLQEPRG